MSTTCGGGWFKPLCLLPAVVLLPLTAQAAPPPPHAAAITFNTVCASCHEGECSGRLSFRDGTATAADHMRRYAGALAEQEVAALFEQLRHMKEQCAYAPLDVPLPADRVWRREVLQLLFSPAGKGYFIPLGLLESGDYTVDLEFEDDADFRLEVLDSQFRFLLERSECTPGRKTSAGFSVETRVQAYLRIFPSSPLLALRLK